MAYKVGRVVATSSIQATKATAEGVTKAAKWTEKKIVGLHNKFDMAQKNSMLMKQGMREANLLSHDAGKAARVGMQKGSSKFAQSKFGQTLSRAAEGVKNGLLAAGKALAGAVKGAAAAIGAIAGAGGLLLIVLLLIFVVLIGVVYMVVLGDDNAKGSIFDRSTSVVEMVEYLEEKNAAWLEEIENLANSQPTTLDKHGDRLQEYTKVHYTYYDATGHACMTTNNTKEIISMAAVYFEQDFSDADKVYEYLDELWEKSHILTASESAVYNEGNEDICFVGAGQFADPTTQGFNGHERAFYCNEDYTTVSYVDCYEYEAERAYREYMDKRSFRFADIISSFNKYAGINMMTESYTRGYGCQEETGRFYCTSINSIGNTEVLVRLVDATGISYSTLSNDEGCEQKHNGVATITMCTIKHILWVGVILFLLATIMNLSGMRTVDITNGNTLTPRAHTLLLSLGMERAVEVSLITLIALLCLTTVMRMEFIGTASRFLITSVMKRLVMVT